MAYTIRQLARIAGVTVRTLHHYDAIGLLRPARRTPAGYRLYGEAELYRLQQILLYRELDVRLEAVQALLDDGADPLATLAAHRRALEERRARIDVLLATIDRTIGRLKGEVMLRDEALYAGFTPEKIEHVKREAERLYGDRYREADRRVRSWSRERFAEVRARGEAIERRIAALHAAGEGARSREVQAAIGAWAEHLRAFYEPTPELFAGLGRLYVESPEFRARYEALAPGLPELLREAMALYARTALARRGP